MSEPGSTQGARRRAPRPAATALGWPSPGLTVATVGTSSAALAQAATAAGWQTAVIEAAIAEDKASLVEALGRALEAPTWFGHNWDALVDLLAERSNQRHVPLALVVIGSEALGEPDRTTLVEILAGAAVRSADGSSPLAVVLLPRAPRGRGAEP